MNCARKLPLMSSYTYDFAYTITIFGRSRKGQNALIKHEKFFCVCVLKTEAVERRRYIRQNWRWAVHSLDTGFHDGSTHIRRYI